MPTRIGGPMVGVYIPPCTWGSMRSPLVLNGLTHGASYTRYSRAWPASGTPPKFFKWDSGSLFRQLGYTSDGPAAPPNTPYYWIGNEEVEGVTYTRWAVGIVQQPERTVDNQDFQPLIGEALDTDIGTFIVTADAHDINQGGQLLSDQSPGGTEIYDIGKLTGF